MRPNQFEMPLEPRAPEDHLDGRIRPHAALFEDIESFSFVSLTFHTSPKPGTVQV
jgi:hypothetical protein